MLSQEITIVYTGRWHAHELRHPAESVHHRMHLDAPVSPGSVMRLSGENSAFEYWLSIFCRMQTQLLQAVLRNRPTHVVPLPDHSRKKI